MSSGDASDRGIRYRILLAPRALTDVDGIYYHIARDAPRAAELWVERVLDAVEGLSTFPSRCARAPEAAVLRVGLRQQWVGDYRVLFVVDEERRLAKVLHIRHGARQGIDPGETDDWE